MSHTEHRQPNIVFILSDQQRWDTMGCYGQRLNITPNLDQMAQQGVKFEHAFTMQPVCGPARACFQTGQYATQNGCITNGRPLPLDAPTLARSLNDAGYETAYVGKWHLATDRRKGEEFRTTAIPPQRRGGYQHWMASDALEATSHGYEGYFHDADGNRVDWEGYRVDKTTDYALDYLRDYATRTRTTESTHHLSTPSATPAQPAYTPSLSEGEGRGEGGALNQLNVTEPAAGDPTLTPTPKPFFLFLSYIEPHHQNDLDRYVGPIGSKQRFSDYDTPGDLAAFDSPGSPGPDWRQHYPDYLGCCWSIDQNVARLREALALHGLDDNTIIIYTSDHGSHFRTRNREYKRSCHESSIRVPLIIHGPSFTGFTGGKTVNELVSTLDLPATVLHNASAAPLPGQAGRPLNELVDGTAKDWPDDVFVQISEAEVGRAVRTARWKYGVTAPDKQPGQDAGSDHYVETYLYDLDNDPHELNNLAADPAYAEVRAELAARLKRRMTQAGETEPTIN